MLLPTRAERWRTAETPGNPPLHEIALTTAGPHAATSDGVLVAQGSEGWETVLNDGPALRDAGLRSMAVTDDGTRLWFVDRSGTLSAYDVESGTRHDLTPPTDGSTWVGVAVAGESGEERGLVAHDSGEVRAFVGTGTDVSWGTTTNPTAENATVAVLTVSRNGTGYAVDTNGNASRTAGNGWKRMGRIDSNATLHGVHAGGKGRVAVAAADGFVYQYDPKENTWVPRRVTNAPIHAVDSADGTLVVGAGDGDVYVEPAGERFWQVSHTPVSEPIRDLEADGETVVAVGGRFLTQQTGQPTGGNASPAESDVPRDGQSGGGPGDGGGLWKTGKSTSPDGVSGPKVDGANSTEQPSKERPKGQSPEQPSGQQSETGTRADGQTKQQTPTEQSGGRTAEKQSGEQSGEQGPTDGQRGDQQSGSKAGDETSKKSSGKQTSQNSSGKQSSQNSSGKQSSQKSSEKQSSQKSSEKQSSQKSSENLTEDERQGEQSTDSKTGPESPKRSEQTSAEKQAAKQSDRKQGTTEEDLWSDTEQHDGLWKSNEGRREQSGQDPLDYFEEHELFVVVDFDEVDGLGDCVTVLTDESGNRYAVQLASAIYPERCSDPVSRYREERDELVVEPFDEVESFEECVGLVSRDGDVYAVLVDPELGPEREWSALDYFPGHDGFAVAPYVDVDRFDEYVTIVVDDAGERYAVLLGEDV